MPVTVMALVSINEDAVEDLGIYMRATQPLLKSVGAVIRQRFAINDVVVGKQDAKSVLVVDYPDRAAVDAVFQSPEYQAVRENRDRAFPFYQISIIESADVPEAAGANSVAAGEDTA
ncbi:DUF1330 domain-containing protein [uncultured Roseobacter sp.]|uniref:DUF1330 domain-containing protein n=1 Tax=uncultured Roseobacter sp. TaxID=114847 RepID=UPI00260A381C|nr:DUF1330 domain-containing protein [uncultured Roseobacter sp.]